MKKLICFVLILIILGTIILPTYATLESGLKIVSTYSSDIKPSSGDVFVLTYRREDGDVYSTIEVDASLVVNTGKVVPIEPGAYVIEKIEYKGNNIDIDISGYGANNRVEAIYSTPSTLRIIVGFNALKSYSRTFQNDFIVDEDTFYDFDKMNELDKITPQWCIDTGIEMPEEMDEYFLSLDTGDPGPLDYDNPSEEQPSNVEPSIEESSNWAVEPSVPQNVGGEIIEEPNEPSIVDEPMVEKDKSISMFIFFGGALIALVGVVIILKKKQII